MHYRMKPKKNKFAYNIFMFYVDLDEPTLFGKSLRFVSHNRWNLFNFRERDHLEPGQRSLKENILDYARLRGCDLPGGKVTLLTNLCTFGYIFNPVSFYFCSNQAGEPVCAVVEVGNTFGEQKRYFLGPETLQDGQFILRTPKYFYVSPFVALDTEFEFRLTPPTDKLNFFVDDFQAADKFLVTAMSGKRRALTDANLAWFLLKYPLITLKVIGLIHWQALVLYLKGVPHFKKASNPQLQQGVYHAKSHS
jgi:DUF1365 family protein